MIAKIITWGDSRPEAILRMRRSLDEFLIMGVKTNIPFHQQLVGSLRFQAGQFDTRFVEDRFTIEDADQERADIAALVATLVEHHQGQAAASQIGGANEPRGSAWKWSAHAAARGGR